MPFCTQCGGAVDPKDRFCRECGVEVRAGASVRLPQTVTAVRPSSTLPSPADAILEPIPSHDDAEAPRGVLLGPVAAQNPLTFAAPADTSPARRLGFIIGCFVIVAISGVAGYRWFSRSTPEGGPVAVEATEQSLDAPASTAGSQRAAPASTAGAAAGSDATRGEASNVIADFTKETSDGANALGAPDGRTAIIAPGGSLALAWADGPFYNDHGPDVRVDGPVGHRVSYVIFARNGSDEAWARFDINRKGFVDGTASHDFGHHGIVRAQQIMIRNEGTNPLYLDAVTALHREPETHAEAESGGHRPAR